MKEGKAAYLWGKLHFFEESHLFRALLAGNVAQVQDLRDGTYYDRFHIPLCTSAVLYKSNYKSCLFNSTLHVRPPPIFLFISTVTNCTMARHWCNTTWLSTRYWHCIRVTNLLNISTTCWKNVVLYHNHIINTL